MFGVEDGLGEVGLVGSGLIEASVPSVGVFGARASVGS